MTAHQTASDSTGIAVFELRLHAQFKAESAIALAAFQDALHDLIEFVAEDAIYSGRAIPGGRGAYGPDVTTMDRLYAKAVECAAAAFAPKPVPVVERRRAGGLLTVHNPDERLASCRSQPEGSQHGS